MLYRIHTENNKKYKEQAIRCTSRHFDGFTILNGLGYWQGQKENSLIIEIVGEKDIKPKILELAQDIKRANKQQAVLVQELENNSLLI